MTYDQEPIPGIDDYLDQLQQIQPQPETSDEKPPREI